jgi:microcystin-dependent protein
MSGYRVKGIQAKLPVGTILYYAGTTDHLPSDWKLCNGMALSRTTYPELYAFLGTKYGNNNSSDFKVPNLSGKRIRGHGDFTITHVATDSGANTVSLNSDHLPQHSHGGKDWSHNHSYTNNQKFHDAGGTGNPRYVTKGNSSTDDSNYTMRWNSHDGGTGTTASQGSGTAFALNPAYLKLFAIIKVM